VLSRGRTVTHLTAASGERRWAECEYAKRWPRATTQAVALAGAAPATPLAAQRPRASNPSPAIRSTRRPHHQDSFPVSGPAWLLPSAGPDHRLHIKVLSVAQPGWTDSEDRWQRRISRWRVSLHWVEPR